MKPKKLFLLSTIVVALAAATVTLFITPTMAMQQSQEIVPTPKSIIGAKGVMAFVVKMVDSGSAAEQAGLKAGDLVTDLGEQINSIEEFQKRIWQSEPGTTFRVTYLRFNPATGQLEEHNTAIQTKAFSISGKTSGS
jgi:S1-C subfamily serine protease